MMIGDVWVTSAAELSALAGVHRTTAARWLATRELPPAVYRLLRLLQHGELGEISAAWAGWRLARDGCLYAPNDRRRGFAPGHLLAAGWRAHQLGALKRELRAAAQGATDPAVQLAELGLVPR